MTPQEEEEFRRLAALPNVYEVISKSIAPSIFGGTDMKKAIACLLFGGSRKRWGFSTARSGEGMGAWPMEGAAEAQDLNVLTFPGPSALPAIPSPFSSIQPCCQPANGQSVLSYPEGSRDLG